MRRAPPLLRPPCWCCCLCRCCRCCCCCTPAPKVLPWRLLVSEATLAGVPLRQPTTARSSSHQRGDSLPPSVHPVGKAPREGAACAIIAARRRPLHTPVGRQVRSSHGSNCGVRPFLPSYSRMDPCLERDTVHTPRRIWSGSSRPRRPTDPTRCTAAPSDGTPRRKLEGGQSIVAFRSIARRRPRRRRGRPAPPPWIASILCFTPTRSLPSLPFADMEGGGVDIASPLLLMYASAAPARLPPPTPTPAGRPRSAGRPPGSSTFLFSFS
jgi:hypothetical protein